jgi:beta-ribofuranosylaminobenzene 5'-phosphate synthase
MEAYPPPAKGAREARLPSHQATVTTTARLHLGFLDPSGRGPRPFGSFGLSLDRPRTRLTLRRSQTLEVSGPESERALRYLKAVAASFRFPKAYALNVEQAIPPHAGLGSGTQLALAVGSAFAALGGLRLDAQDVAARLGRGARSGIGIATFALGGVVLDGGPRTDALPQLVSRLPFPSAWRVLLILDPRAQGLAGAGETAAFDQLPDFPESETEELYQRIQQGALPALAVSDFAGFCAQVGYLQAVMGRYFGPLQGGPYTSPAVSSVLEWLRGQGFTGIGQSSWGPTGFAFVPSQASGEALLDAVKARAHESGVSFDLAEGRNEGAIIETAAGEIR